MVARLPGGRRGALESALPSVVFVTVYLSSRSLTWGLSVALAVAAVLAVLRLLRRERPVRVLGGLAGVAIAAVVAARTGNAADYFLPSLFANVASALVWAASIVARWPLLGVIIGFAIGQKTAWRADPDLLRAYNNASWIWAGSFVMRAAINTPLYLTDNLLGLYAILSGKGRELASAECAAMGWGTFKPLLAEATVEALRPVQQRYAELSADPAELDRVLAAGRERAQAVAQATLERTREALGFLARG
jgi:hypothetical protein